ncbi:MAG: hypothetical protein IPQ28_07020 [Sphingobacteriales bacterium]|nr:hypothetical protein [Sphingobacteriales bacterium]
MRPKQKKKKKKQTTKKKKKDKKKKKKNLNRPYLQSKKLFNKEANFVAVLLLT